LGWSEQRRGPLPAALLGLLDLLPLLVRGLAVLHDGAAVHVRVAADELVRGALERLRHADAPLLAQQLEAEDHEEAEVAQFLRGVVRVTGGDGLDGLDGLLGEVGRHRLERLLAVPRAAVRAAQPPADAQQLLECFAFALGHGREP